MFESPRLSTSLRSIRLARLLHEDDDNDHIRDTVDGSSSATTGLFSDDKDGNANSYGTTPRQEAEVEEYYRSQVKEACALFTIVGIGYLFPFSALTQPIDYWNLLFPDFNMEFPLTTLYMWTNLIMLAALVFCGGHGHGHGSTDGVDQQEQGEKSASSSSSSSHHSFFTRRIVGGFVGQLLVLVAVPTYYFGHWDEPTNVLAILGSTAFAAIVTAFIDSSVIALVAQYPLRVQEYFQLGVGVSTLIGSVYRDATKWAFPPEAIVESSLLYFYSGAATIGVCIVAYYRLMQLPLSKQCLSRAVQEAEIEEDEGKLLTYYHQNQYQHPEQQHDNNVTTEQSALLPKVPTSTGNNTKLLTTTTVTSTKTPSITTRSITTTTIGTTSTSSSSSSMEEQQQEPVVPKLDRYQVLRKVWFNECMVLLFFLSTLALWPALVTEIPAYHIQTQQRWEATGWWSLLLLTVFSFADCAGRLLVRFRMVWNKDNIWIAVALRCLVLFPLIVGQVQGWFVTVMDDDTMDTSTMSSTPTGWPPPGWPLADIWSAWLVGLLGMTNGYVGTLCIVLVNDCLETTQEQAIAGTFTSFFLNSGLVLGATFGLLFDAILVVHYDEE